MRLTGQQSEQLMDALLDAFPTRTDLQMLVVYELGVNLHSITQSRDLRGTVFDLVTWAETQHRTDDLLRAALAKRPLHAELREFVQQATEAAPQAPAALATHPRTARSWLGPLLWEGVARIFDFRNVLGPYGTGQAPEEADYWALRSDWEALGEDIQSALAQFAAAHSDELAEPTRAHYGPTS